jgi:hypothetical protein
VSGDGSLVVGKSHFSTIEPPIFSEVAFIWNEAHGMRSLIDLLRQEYGLAEELTGWQLTEANGISDDGLVIAGGGINPAGRAEAWVAILDRRPDVLVGDYNGNGLVEQADLDLVLSHWGNDAAVPPPTWINDLPAGNIDQDELDAALAGWGNSAASPRATTNPAAVPEASTAALLLIGVATTLARRESTWTSRHRVVAP